VVSKKEPKAKAKKARGDKDDPGEAKAAAKKAAAKKPKPVKARKKKVVAEVAAKVVAKVATKGAGKSGSKGSGKSESKGEPATHHNRILVPAPAKETDAGGSAGAKLDPFEVAKQRVKGSVPAIVAAMVKKAKAGSCTHAKTLLEMTGAKHMFDGEGEAQNSGEPWAKLVLERLDEADGRGASVQQEAAPGSKVAVE
jgi:hypothetical protein